MRIFKEGILIHRFSNRDFFLAKIKILGDLYNNLSASLSSRHGENLRSFLALVWKMSNFKEKSAGLYSHQFSDQFFRNFANINIFYDLYKKLALFLELVEEIQNFKNKCVLACDHRLCDLYFLNIQKSVFFAIYMRLSASVPLRWWTLQIAAYVSLEVATFSRKERR